MDNATRAVRQCGVARGHARMRGSMTVFQSRLRRTLIAALATCGLVAATVTVATGAQPPEQHVRATHRISFDHYSLMIDGRRTVVWSGEFHPFRLPSPGEWLDVLEKMKAEGYDAVSMYFDWSYHSASPGQYDFTGVRNMDLALDMAARVGLYVIVRPGPYINAEVSGGGLPGWLTTQAGRARTNAPDYLAAADQWLSAIDPILARHQLTNGTGTVILYQVENELASTSSAELNYLDHLVAKARGDGITVPIFHNDKGRNGFWVPSGSTVPGTVPGPVDLYAFDGYPGGTCSTSGATGRPNTAPDWGMYGPGGAKGGATASPDTPGFAAEFGGGWFDYWGSVGTYACMAQREGPGYERVFYETNIANGLSMQNVYMTFGGTSWGWLPAPVVYTSYDYGAAISEARQLRPKVSTMKELGYFLAGVDPVTHLDPGAAVTPSSPSVKVYHDVDQTTGTQFYVAMHNPSNATTDDAFTFAVDTPSGPITVPRQGTLRINGQDAKTLLADYDFEGQHLVYSTSELMTHLRTGDQDVVLLHGRAGEDGETALSYPTAPTVRVLSGSATASFDPATGLLRLDYIHSGLTRVRVTGGGRPALTLLLADDATADTFWRQDTAAGPVLERGSELVRTADVRGGVLALTGDTSGPADLEVWAPAGVRAVTWNNGFVPASRTGSGSLLANRRLPGPAPVTLPDLSTLDWRSARESPEANPSFDDSTWQQADKTTTSSTTPPPAGAPVLTADDYGFHTGDVWYRGRFSGATGTVSVRYGGGAAGLAQVWLDGTYLGQNVLPAGTATPQTTGTATFTVPASLATPGGHVLAVMVRDDGHNEDGGINDAHKEGRGLISVTADATAGPITWRIQGGTNVDPVRGPLNNGGLYGELNGWYLPGFPDRGWQRATLPAASAPAGTSWYRATFRLDVPGADDASLGITIGDPNTPRGTGNYRALLFVNGWNMGQYIANVGPQHTFVVPNGVLNPHGGNTIAIAVTSDGGAGNGLERVSLTDLGTVRGGVPVPMDHSPGWRP